MTILDQPFNNNPGCFGMCKCGTGSSHQQGPFKNSHRVPLSVSNTNGFTSENGLTSDDQQKTKEIDNLLSQALNNLSFKERQEQQEVLHGIDSKVCEDATSIQAGLKELDDHLLKSKKGTTYELAETMDPQYVSSRDFRLIFLRTDRYDPKNAAKRMLRFFEMKEKLFGTEKLVKDITLDDMDEDDIACIKNGSLQRTGRDISGRQIFVNFPGLRKFKTVQNELRAQYYITMSALESEETQIRGCLWVVYGIGDHLQDHSGGRGFAECAVLQMTIPPYKASIHCALDSIQDYLSMNLAAKMLPLKMRARMKLHYGSHVECQYRLSTFGILPLVIPYSQRFNQVNLERHLQWVESCRVAERRGKSQVGQEQVITAPTSNDVVCIGTKKNNNMGNQYLLALVKEQSKAYADARTDKLKREVVAVVAGKIHDSGGRFLKKCEGGSMQNWEEMTDVETRKKIMQAFRNLRRRLDASKQKGIVHGTLIEGAPLPADVIFGRLQRNPGCDLLQRLVKERFEEYESLDRGMKMRLVESIIQTIKDQGGRFLQPATEAGGWLEVPSEAALVRERVSQYFRNNRRPTKHKVSY